MSSIGMEDALKPTDAAFKAFYERSFRTWYRVWAATANDCRLPSVCLEWEHLFPQHAFLPVGVDLNKYGMVTARSIWASAQGCSNLPTVEQTFEFPLAISAPVSTILSDNPPVSLSRWFGDDDRHVVVLTYAWAYALSARLAEIIPQAPPVRYTPSKARWETDPRSCTATENEQYMFVALGNLNEHATRWWEAILAPGEGWKAELRHHRSGVLSPWSITKDCSGVNIILTGSPSHNEFALDIPASFEVALTYIEDYTALHNAHIHNRAALAAALLLPQAKVNNKKIYFHAPKGLCKQQLDSRAPRRPLFWDCSFHQFDKLLTLSANRYGMKAVLGSIFYTSNIPANICGAWLQGTMAVLKEKGSKDIHILAQMFFYRNPRISFLWLGAIITGTHKHFLQDIYSLMGLNRIDLHAATWTNTLLSFIQEPVLPLQNDSKSISRADECRLMFLAQDRPRDNPPIFPYPPLGETDIIDTDLGVQMHAHCAAKHHLQLLSITWNCTDGQKVTQETGPIGVASEDSIVNKEGDGKTEIEVDYSYLDRDGDHSEGVTRNIFTWMRDMDGFTVAERDIYQHEWIDAFDSDDDESVHPEGDGHSAVAPNLDAEMGCWMAGAMIRRSNSM